MIIKKKIGIREQLDYLTHGGKEKLSKEEIEAYSAPENSETRRNFLKKLSLASAGLVMAPSVLELANKRLFAQSACPPFDPLSSTSSMPGVIEFHARGGDQYPADIALKGVDGDFLTGTNPYILHGRDADNDVHAFGGTPPSIGGIPFHDTNTALYRGLFVNDITNPGGIIEAARPHLAGMVVACRTSSDSDQNKMVGAHFYALVGRTGSLSDLVGTDGSATGARYQFAVGPTKPNTSPFFLQSGDSVRALSGLGNIFNSNSGLSDEAVQKILEATSRMSRSSLQEFVGLSLPDQVKTLVSCGYINAEQLPFAVDGDDLFNAADPLLGQAFPGSQNSARAAVAHSVLTGLAGFGAVSDGGHDPHNGSAQSGHNARFNTGRRIAQMINYAHLLNKPLFVIGLTDGGMRPGDSTNPDSENLADGGVETRWTGDNDRMALAFALYYDPSHTTGEMLRDPSNVQIGAFDSSGVVSSSAITTEISNLPLIFAYNYLILQGQEEKLLTLTGGRVNPFEGPDNLKYRIFKKLV